MASVGARLHQHIMVRGQRDEVPVKLMTFSYLRDYSLHNFEKFRLHIKHATNVDHVGAIT